MRSPQRLTAQATVQAILAGQVSALSKAITLVESERAEDQALAETVLAGCLPATGRALRVGITGTPGVGKSTLIEALGLYLVHAGHKLAVLAVDPTSLRSGGSILGDKTRMQLLAQQTAAYIRPSPTSGALGGVNNASRESILLCEAAGFDVVLVETVGVGQSETQVRSMVDAFVLLVQPGGGDELQGIKRGIMEMADLVLVTKADGELLAAAQRARAEYQNALHLLPPRVQGWQVPVELVSAFSNQGITHAWQVLQGFYQQLLSSGQLQVQRQSQLLSWFEQALQAGLWQAMRKKSAYQLAVQQLQASVNQQNLTPPQAAKALLKSIGMVD